MASFARPWRRTFDQRFLPTDRPDEFHSIDRTAGPFGGLRFVREGEKATRIESFAIAFERVGLLFQPRTLLALAALTLGVSLATLLGLRIRLRRGFPQTLAQRLAAWLQGLSATAWIASAGAAAALAAALADDAPTVVFFAWPHPAILVSTTAALLATLLAAAASSSCQPSGADGRPRPDGRWDASCASRRRRRSSQSSASCSRSGGRCSRGIREQASGRR